MKFKNVLTVVVAASITILTVVGLYSYHVTKLDAEATKLWHRHMDYMQLVKQNIEADRLEAKSQSFSL